MCTFHTGPRAQIVMTRQIHARLRQSARLPRAVLWGKMCGLPKLVRTVSTRVLGVDSSGLNLDSKRHCFFRPDILFLADFQQDESSSVAGYFELKRPNLRSFIYVFLESVWI